MEPGRTGLALLVAAALTLGTSGIPAWGLQSPTAGQRLATGLMVLGSLLGLGGVVLALASPETPSWTVPWALLPWGPPTLALDPLSAFFLVPVLVVGALGSLYGLGYWTPAEHPGNGRRLGLSWGLLVGGMAVVVIAGDGVLFLIAWEVMALAAWFAATVEEDDPDAQRAGWVYLIATHVGTLALIAMFALWRHATGSLALTPAATISPGMAGALFGLALVGFGFKAGLMPLHVWLPGAHANAPSHVSALMSGVMLKMGVYGIVRMTALLPAPTPWWGGTLLAVGALSGIAGVAFAIGQRDLKRLLAYSSIENVGIIAMGIGLALLGRSFGRPDLVVLGMAGALLHVWNHGLFKSLLFLAAGAVIHATGTREIDRLGGLARRMPRVSALFGVGALAICALPPLNGFVGEWFLYLGFLRTLAPGVPGGAAEVPGTAVATVALALIGALAVACFVQVAGVAFLGAARSAAPARAHDPPGSMTLPMAALAAGCLALGLFPGPLAPLLDRAVASWVGASLAPPPLGALAPLGRVTLLGLLLVGVAGAGALALARVTRRGRAAERPTWDCGYAEPGPRMQYTGSSFGQTLVELFAFVLWPKSHRRRLDGLFPRGGRFRRAVPDPVLDRMVVPLFRGVARGVRRLRVLQQGQTQVYVLYLLLVLVALLLWGAMGGPQ